MLEVGEYLDKDKRHLPILTTEVLDCCFLKDFCRCFCCCCSPLSTVVFIIVVLAEVEPC